MEEAVLVTPQDSKQLEDPIRNIPSTEKQNADNKPADGKARRLISKISSALSSKSDPEPLLKTIANLDLAESDDNKLGELRSTYDLDKDQSDQEVEEQSFDFAELTDREKDFIADLEEKANIFRKSVDNFNRTIKYFKDNPQMILASTAALLGATGMLNTPIPPDLAAKGSIALGLGLVGYNQGEGRKGKIAGVAAGVIAALGISEGIHHFTDTHVIEAGVSVADDVLPFAAVLSAKKKGSRHGRKMRKE